MGKLERVARGIACLWLLVGRCLAATGGMGCAAPEDAGERTGAASAALTAIAETFPAADARGIRRFDDHAPFLLDFLAIKTGGGLEDRTVITLDLTQITGQLVSATLNLGISNFDLDNAESGMIDVYTFTPATATVTPDELFAGTFFTSFAHDAGPGVVSIDITCPVLQALAAGEQYLGIRLSTTTSDRFFLGSTVAEPEPSITVVELVRGPIELIADIEAAIPAVPGTSALQAHIDQATRRIQQAEALFAAGNTAQAQLRFYQARSELDSFIANVNVFVSAGRLTPAQGSELVALAEDARGVLDARLAFLGLSACAH